MNADDFRRLAAWFQAAIEGDRAAILEQCRGPDPGLLERLEAMLVADDQAQQGDRLRDAVQNETRAAEPLPSSIGPFQVLRRLGTGGMGVVYLCRRSGPDFDQYVAVKRLPAAGDSDFGRARLRIERRVLASLRHPNIAQLVDGGEEPDGTPWVAMEYIEGRAIDRWADEQRLDRRGRVQHFLALCDAVQFAHRNLVIHRDLKTSNVLIDRNGQLKLLDFGIAKLIDNTEPEDAGAEDGMAMTVASTMTPHYASPEQVRHEPVTQASDVYSLGVLLFELLAGRRPYDFPTRRPSDIERVVCQTEPPPLGGRNTIDLDCIIARAMHKDPGRRYASARELADDLRRWLDGRPVEARRESTLYRAGRFLRRHPFGALFGSLGLVLLIGFSATMTWQTHRLAEERDRASHEAQVANESAQFMLQLFLDSDPLLQNPAELRALDLLNTAAERLPDALASEPMVRARLMEQVGMAFAGLGDFEQSIRILREALDITLEETGEDSIDTAQARSRLGDALRQHSQLDEAEALLQASIERLQRDDAGEIGLSQALNGLGIVQRNLGKYEEAERSLRRSIKLHIERDGESSLPLAASYFNLSRTLRSLDRYEEARTLALRSLAMQRSEGGAPARIGLTLSQLADIERNLGLLDEAESHAREGLALYIEVYGENNHLVTRRIDGLAKVLYAKGDVEPVRALFESALDIHRNLDTIDRIAGARTMMSYGRFLLQIGEVQQARPLIEDAHRIAQAFHQADGVAMRSYDNGLRALQETLEQATPPD